MSGGKHNREIEIFGFIIYIEGYENHITGIFIFYGIKNV